ALLTAVLLLIMTVKMHDFWTIEDSQARQADMTGFLKNLSMIGGLLILTWVLSEEGTAYTITDGVL
ncbi:MAG: DoxX family protein, partial [Ilumatobacteraceae bacterium]